MKQDYRHALVFGLERGLLNLPSDADRWAMFNAVPLPHAPSGLISALVCEQPFRPLFQELQKAGYQVEPVLADRLQDGYGAVIVCAGRDRRVNEFNIVRAWNWCKTGGSVIIAGDKTSGIASLRKWAARFGNIADSFSKFHAMVFTVVKTGSEDVELPMLERNADGYEMAEGMFSADGPDTGSSMLANHFSDRISGRVADLGAGWGFLSVELLRRSGRIASLSLFEADWHALEAAKRNLKTATCDLEFHWCDVTSEFRKTPYDWVVMNPPFHTGRAADPELGKRFIAVAASTLPAGGKLLMVANRNLPYEQTLDAMFRGYEILETGNGFKVIEARK